MVFSAPHLSSFFQADDGGFGYRRFAIGAHVIAGFARIPEPNGFEEPRCKDPKSGDISNLSRLNTEY